MNKQILLFKDTAHNRDAFVSMVETDILPRLKASGPTHLKMTLTREAPPGISVIPYSKTAIACISMMGAEMNVSTFSSLPYFYGCYEVTEAMPVAYKIEWSTNTPTPGICLLTLFNRKKGLDADTFLHRRHNGHTPLSLKIHPLWNYNRNVVRRTIAGKTFEGIVEEQVKNRRDLLNPVRFFGGFGMMLINMVRTLVDTKSFIDYASMETYWAEETWVVVPSAPGTGASHARHA